MRKIRFWFEGRGGMRSEEAFRDFPDRTCDDEIEEALHYWVLNLRSNSEVRYFGWCDFKEGHCPRCGSAKYGPGPNFDNLRWIGCYECGYGFKELPKARADELTGSD